MSGIQEWLSFYFKSPMHAPGLYPEHDLFIQLMKLKNTLRYMRGEELITHLGPGVLRLGSSNFEVRSSNFELGGTYMKRHQPALLGGLFIGVLSSLPLVNIGNVCCCLWVVVGGLLTVYLQQQNTPSRSRRATPCSAACSPASSAR